MHSDVGFDPVAQTANLLMHGQGTRAYREGLEFGCTFSIMWFHIETGARIDGCDCRIWWRAKFGTFDNSMVIDCPCVGPFNAANNTPQYEAVSLSDTVHKIVEAFAGCPDGR